MWRCKMIYKKDANFPYPLLTNTSNSYYGCDFILNIDIEENNESYGFKIKYDINSDFINEMLEVKKAQLVLIIKSKDNKFFNVDLGDQHIEIPKTRISLSKRTTLQLLIQSKEEVWFHNNNDLSRFYEDIKDRIMVPANSILGFSNVVLFDGSIRKPFDLFEKKVNPDIKSEIHIELGSETIIIHYRKEEFQFNDLVNGNTLNNHYIYMGLQKALLRFIMQYGQDGEIVDLEEIDPPTGGLDFKLYNLMNKKMVQELTMENIDEVICLISDKILEKHISAVKGLSQNGN